MLLSEIAGVSLVCAALRFSAWTDANAFLNCYEDRKHYSPGLCFVLQIIKYTYDVLVECLIIIGL